MKKIQLIMILSLLAIALPLNGYAQQNIRGDVNCDGEVNIADVNAAIDAILSHTMNSEADVNYDGEVNIADVNAIINIILNPHATPDNCVDLGLPSGTLWATMNIGANKPEDYGSYFAWGEITPKNTYYWSTYKWSIEGYEMMSKYCTSTSHGTVDNLTELEYADDVAFVAWGESWRLPTTSQQNELLTKCSWKWTKRNGVNGYLVTGPNGNTLFLPAAGYRIGGSTTGAGSRGCYWSMSLFIGYSRFAYGLLFSSTDVSCDGNYRYLGHTVRPVVDFQYQW